MPQWLLDLINSLSGGGYPTPYAPAGGGYGSFTPGGYGTQAAGAGGGGTDWLGLLLQLASAGGGAYYGNQELQNAANVYKQQQQDAQIAMNPVMMAQRLLAASGLITPQINQQLAYQVNRAADLGSAVNGMAQSPGAVASARASALAPYAEQDVLEGLNLGQQEATAGFPYAFSQQPPDYLQILGQLQNLGAGTALPGVA